MTRRRTIGLIGIGLVGSALAARLKRAGFCVLGFDVNRAQRRSFSEHGGVALESVAEVFERCGRVILSLPNSDVVTEVIREAGPQLRRGTRIIDTTTGEPAATVRLAGRLRRRGVRYVDATLVGSSAQIGAGEAMALVGGKREDFSAAHDVLTAIAAKSVHTGPCGSAARMKLVVNLVLGLNRAALAEALAFAKAIGVSQKDALGILKAGVAYSRVMDSKGEKMIARNFAPQARLAQHLKDVRLMIAASPIPLPLSAAHRRLLEKAVAMGLGDADNSAIIQAFLKS